jgi:hypothetical protein
LNIPIHRAKVVQIARVVHLLVQLHLEGHLSELLVAPVYKMSSFLFTWRIHVSVEIITVCELQNKPITLKKEGCRKNSIYIAGAPAEFERNPKTLGKTLNVILYFVGTKTPVIV